MQENIERLEMGDEEPLHQIPQTSTLREYIFQNEEKLEEPDIFEGNIWSVRFCYTVELVQLVRIRKYILVSLQVIALVQK